MLLSGKQHLSALDARARGDPCSLKQPWDGRVSMCFLDLCWFLGDKLGTLPLPDLVSRETSEDGFWGHLERQRGRP